MQQAFSQERRLVKTSTPGIYKRGSSYVVTFRDPHGRQCKRTARTLAEARDLKSALTADVKRGEYRAFSGATFGDYACEWIEAYTGRTSRGVRPETLADYKKLLEQDAVPFFGPMKLVAIEPRDIKRFAAHLAARGLGQASVRKALAPVRALLASAFEDGLIRANPAAGVRIAQPRSEHADEPVHAKALTEEELRAFLDALSEDEEGKGWGEWRLFFEFLAHTGLRISEAIALTWADVDLDSHRVHVRRRLYRGRIDTPKSRYGRRSVPLTDGLSLALRQHRGTRTDEAFVFATKTGKQLAPSNLMNRVLKPAARKTGVPWAGFHTFRHTCATLLFRYGLNAKQVQIWLGHHSPAFTLGTYVHLAPEDLPEPHFLDSVTGARPAPGVDESSEPEALAVASGRGWAAEDDEVDSVPSVEPTGTHG